MEVNTIKLLSVGVDVGSSTSHLVFSDLLLKRDEASPTRRFVIDDRQVIYEGKIISIDTPDGHFEKTGMDNLEDIFITYELKKTPSSEVISYKNMKSSIRGRNNEKL